MPHVLDLGSRRFWRLTGRAVDLDGRESWLRAPMSRSPKVTDGWLEAEAWRHGGVRTDHELRLWNAWAMRLHHKLQRAA